MQNKQPNTQNFTKILIWFILIVFVFLGGFVLGKVDLQKESDAGPDYKISGDLKSSFKNVDVNLLWEVWSQLEKEYIDPDIDGQNLLYGAAKGLVSSLDDPYTAYLTPEETKEYLSSNKGEFEGIGATLKQEGEYVAIESPLDDFPAQAAGLHAGDIITEVDGQEMRGISVFEVAAIIRGEAGTSVEITVFRPSTSEELSFEITRAKIDIDNIAFKEIDNGLVEIKIYKFTEESVDAFNKQWDAVVEKTLAANPKGIIVDVRNNPGGFVSSVEYVTSEFLEKGDVIFMEEEKDGRRTTYKVNRTGKLADIPVVVLVNEGSASASEIFAGAMQDHDRAQIIGMPTVGKGVEQRLIELSDGSTLQVVFQKWLTPNGKNISKDQPIQPDKEIEDGDEQYKKAEDLLN